VEIYINVEYISLLKSALFLEKQCDLWYNRSNVNPQKFKGRSAFYDL
jgi:hypothetical protein